MSLREMREARPQFFKNALESERYNVRGDYLIVTGLETGKIRVWQFLRDQERLHPLSIDFKSSNMAIGWAEAQNQLVKDCLKTLQQ